MIKGSDGNDFWGASLIHGLNTVNNNKLTSRADMPSCVPFVFAKGIIVAYCALSQLTSDTREASGFVITTEPLGFVLIKQVNDFLLRLCKGSNSVNQYDVSRIWQKSHTNQRTKWTLIDQVVPTGPKIGTYWT